MLCVQKILNNNLIIHSKSGLKCDIWVSDILIGIFIQPFDGARSQELTSLHHKSTPESNCWGSPVCRIHLSLCDNTQGESCMLLSSESICIWDFVQTTFFYFEKFLKKLADDQCISITDMTEGSIYHIKHYVHTSMGSPYTSLHPTSLPVVTSAFSGM